MKVGDPEYKRQIELINAFPTSCKVDEDNMDKYSDKDMERFEEHSERILREQVRAYSDTDLKIIADEITKIGWTYTYNALGEFFDRLYKQKEATLTINQE